VRALAHTRTHAHTRTRTRAHTRCTRARTRTRARRTHARTHAPVPGSPPERVPPSARRHHPTAVRPPQRGGARRCWRARFFLRCGRGRGRRLLRAPGHAAAVVMGGVRGGAKRTRVQPSAHTLTDKRIHAHTHRPRNHAHTHYDRASHAHTMMAAPWHPAAPRRSSTDPARTRAPPPPCPTTTNAAEEARRCRRCRRHRSSTGGVQAPQDALPLPLSRPPPLAPAPRRPSRDSSSNWRARAPPAKL
jgi:hypothetical protein